MARLNIDQPLGSNKDSLLKFNVNIANPYKAGLGIKYLEDYLGSEAVKKSISEFYSENKLKLGTEKEFAAILQKNANKNIDWFFNDYVNTSKKIDFKITKLKKRKDSLQVTIKNKRNNNMPVSLYGIKDDKIVYKIFYRRIYDFRMRFGIRYLGSDFAFKEPPGVTNITL